MKKIIGVSLASLLIISCGGNNATNNATANAPPKTNGNIASNAVNTNTTSANTTNTNTVNTNKPANAATAATKPAVESSPKRIAFGAGKSESTENLTLAAGESKQFVVGAKTAQVLMIDAESIDANAVHGSDSLENANQEIEFFF